MPDEHTPLTEIVRERTVPKAKEPQLPPPPPGVRHVRVPFAEIIVIADDHLRARINRFFHWPMIILALIMLPIIAVDLLILAEHRELTYSWMWWLCMAGIWIIWLAFLIEFVIKIAVAESRFEYVKRNWLDVIILIVPFLRPLRVWRIAKTARVFTLRGVGMKAARYGFTLVIGLEATDRVLSRIGLKDDKGRKDPREMTRHELISETKQLRRLVDGWEDWYAEHRAYLQSQGHDFHRHLPPSQRMLNESTDESDEATDVADEKDNHQVPIHADHAIQSDTSTTSTAT